MELNGIHTQTNSVAIREKIYNAALRAQLEPYLMAQQFVDVISEFTDGEKFIDIEIGNATVHDYIEGNDRARYLYEKMGFVETARVPDVYRLKDGSFRKSILMMKKL